MTERPDVELFGPLLQVVKVDDFDEAIAEANNTRFGLSASLIGGNPQDYDHFWANIRAGIVNWNRPTNGASSGRAVRRHRLVGQPSPGGVLRRRLLRLSGGPAPRWSSRARASGVGFTPR